MDNSVSVLFMCTSCGLQSCAKHLFVDISMTPCADDGLVQVTISECGTLQGNKIYNMCFSCLLKYLLENGLDEKQVEQVVNRYQNQVKEIEVENVVV